MNSYYPVDITSHILPFKKGFAFSSMINGLNDSFPIKGSFWNQDFFNACVANSPPSVIADYSSDIGIDPFIGPYQLGIQTLSFELYWSDFIHENKVEFNTLIVKNIFPKQLTDYTSRVDITVNGVTYSVRAQQIVTIPLGSAKSVKFDIVTMFSPNFVDVVTAASYFFGFDVTNTIQINLTPQKLQYKRFDETEIIHWYMQNTLTTPALVMGQNTPSKYARGIGFAYSDGFTPPGYWVYRGFAKIHYSPSGLNDGTGSLITCSPTGNTTWDAAHLRGYGRKLGSVFMGYGFYYQSDNLLSLNVGQIERYIQFGSMNKAIWPVDNGKLRGTYYPSGGGSQPIACDYIDVRQYARRDMNMAGELIQNSSVLKGWNTTTGAYQAGNLTPLTDTSDIYNFSFRFRTGQFWSGGDGITPPASSANLLSGGYFETPPFWVDMRVSVLEKNPYYQQNWANFQ